MARLVADLQKRMERTEVGLIPKTRDRFCGSGGQTRHSACLPQPVTVLRDISDQSVFTNKEAEFQCDITINYPEIALSWYKGTQKLESGDKYDISVSGDRHLLRIRRCQASDQGNYRVVCGPHISSAKLTIMGEYRDRVLILAPFTITSFFMSAMWSLFW